MYSALVGFIMCASAFCAMLPKLAIVNGTRLRLLPRVIMGDSLRAVHYECMLFSAFSYLEYEEQLVLLLGKRQAQYKVEAKHTRT